MGCNCLNLAIMNDFAHNAPMILNESSPRKVTAGLVVIVIVVTSLLAAGCATAKPAAPVTPSADSASQKSSTVSVADLQKQISGDQKALADANDRLQKLTAQMSEVEQKNQDLTNRNNELTKVLGRIAYEQKKSTEQLTAEASASQTAATLSGSGAGAGHSLTADSMVLDTLTSDGEHVLTDARANAPAGTPLFLSVRYKDNGPPTLMLTCEYRYPVYSDPFLTRSITVVEGKTSISLPLDRFTVEWYRSGPFRVEAYTTSDVTTIETVLSLLLGKAEPATSAGSQAATLQPPSVVQTGISSSVTGIVTPNELQALSNMLYAYHELGGKSMENLGSTPAAPPQQAAATAN